MSYDVSLVIDTGKRMTEITRTVNYTYNVAPMMFLAMGGRTMIDLDGMSAMDAAALLTSGLVEMRKPERQAEFMSLNPKNGWGDLDGCQKFMSEIVALCLEHPKATVSVC